MAEDFLSSSRTRSIAGALLLLLFVALYIVLLGERPLFIPDEMRYGEIPREMLATGDWIVPYLDGLLYFEKPPFGYWLNAMWLWVFGETEFAVRFSSALTTGLSAALVFAVCRALFFSRSVAYVAAFVFLTTLEVQAVGTYSVLDPTFALALNAGIFLMALAAYGEGVRRTALFAGAGVVLGVAFLTKGFLAFVLPVIVIGPWFIIRRQYGLLFRDAWISVVCAVAVVLPWAVAIHLREPDFWHYFIWVEHIKRFAADNAQHKEAFWFFVVLLPALAFPWIFLSPVALRGVRDNVRGQCRDGAVSLLVLWAAVPFLFFTVASGKLPTYILPCFLPFSALMAAGLVHSTASIRSVRLSLGAAVIAILVFSAALYVYATNATLMYFHADQVFGLVALMATLAFAVIGLCYAMLTRPVHRRIVATGISVVPFLLVLPLALPESAIASKAPQSFIEKVYSAVPEDVILVSDTSLIRAVSWSTKRADVFVIGGAGETSYGLRAAEGRGRFLEPQALAKLLDDDRGALVFCKRSCNASTLSVIPDNATSYSQGKFSAHIVLPQRARAAP